MKKKDEGLGMVDLKDALLTRLFVKWIKYAVEPGSSNLQMLLKYHLNFVRLDKSKKWGLNYNLALCHKH